MTWGTTQQLRDEIAALKGQERRKTKFKPSGMETETEPSGDADGSDASDSGGNAGSKFSRANAPGLPSAVIRSN